MLLWQPHCNVEGWLLKWQNPYVCIDLTHTGTVRHTLPPPPNTHTHTGQATIVQTRQLQVCTVHLHTKWQNIRYNAACIWPSFSKKHHCGVFSSFISLLSSAPSVPQCSLGAAADAAAVKPLEQFTVVVTVSHGRSRDRPGAEKYITRYNCTSLSSSQACWR